MYFRKYFVYYFKNILCHYLQFKLFFQTFRYSWIFHDYCAFLKSYQNQIYILCIIQVIALHCYSI